MTSERASPSSNLSAQDIDYVLLYWICALLLGEIEELYDNWGEHQASATATSWWSRASPFKLVSVAAGGLTCPQMAGTRAHGQRTLTPRFFLSPMSLVTGG